VTAGLRLPYTSVPLLEPDKVSSGLCS